MAFESCAGGLARASNLLESPLGPVAVAPSVCCAPSTPSWSEVADVPSLLDIHSVGVSHRDAGFGLRARLSVSSASAEALLVSLQTAGASEALVLSTCNRTEIYACGLRPVEIEEVWAGHVGVRGDCGFIRRSGLCAVCHLTRVGAGLESAVLGETEIVAQIKQAWEGSRAAGMCGRRLNAALRHVLRVGKRVRSETAICQGVTSVASLAVREAARGARGFEGLHVVLLGAGQTAERVAKEIRSLGTARVTVLNRTRERAEELAERYGFECADFEGFSSALAEADVLFSAVASASLVRTSELALLRSGRPTTVVDLGVPPNVLEDGGGPAVRVLSLEGLASACEANSRERQAAVPRAAAIVREELEALEAEARAREGRVSLERTV